MKFNVVLIFIMIVVMFTPVWLPTFFDNDVWNEVIDHHKEFVYDGTSNNGSFATFKLYDKDSTCVCEVLMKFNDKRTSIFSDDHLVTGSLNWYKSRKLYYLLYDRIPEHPDYTDSKKKLLYYFKNN